MVKVEQRPLSALEKNVLVGFERGVNNLFDRGDYRSHPLRPVAALVEDLFFGHRRAAINLRDDGICVLKNALKSRKQRLNIKQVCRSNAGARCLVGVCRPYALARGADGVVAPRLLGKHVKSHMIRHDDVCAVTDDKPAVNVDTPLTETVYLVEQHIRINDYSVADDIDCLWPEYATRDQMEAKLTILVDHGMSGVISAGKPRNNVGVPRQHIDYLTFSFVSPLSA